MGLAKAEKLNISNLHDFILPFSKRRVKMCISNSLSLVLLFDLPSQSTCAWRPANSNIVSDIVFLQKQHKLEMWCPSLVGCNFTPVTLLTEDLVRMFFQCLSILSFIGQQNLSAVFTIESAVTHPDCRSRPTAVDDTHCEHDAVRQAWNAAGMSPGHYLH